MLCIRIHADCRQLSVLKWYSPIQFVDRNFSVRIRIRCRHVLCIRTCSTKISFIPTTMEMTMSTTTTTTTSTKKLSESDIDRAEILHLLIRKICQHLLNIYCILYFIWESQCKLNHYVMHEIIKYKLESMDAICHRTVEKVVDQQTFTWKLNTHTYSYIQFLYFYAYIIENFQTKKVSTKKCMASVIQQKNTTNFCCCCFFGAHFGEMK